MADRSDCTYDQRSSSSGKRSIMAAAITSAERGIRRSTHMTVRGRWFAYGIVVWKIGIIAGIVIVEGQEKPGQQAMTGCKIGHAFRLGKFGMNACRGRIRFQELLAAHHAGTTGDETQFVEQQCSVIVVRSK
jgi:hypothetical protein